MVLYILDHKTDIFPVAVTGTEIQPDYLFMGIYLYFFYLVSMTVAVTDSKTVKDKNHTSKFTPVSYIQQSPNFVGYSN